MPALRGSLTYVRYFVDGELPADLSTFLKPIRLRAMKPLEPQEDVAERSGWCRVGEPFATDLGHGDVFFNEYVNLGFRTNRWAIPGPLLRAKLREAEAAYLERKGRERLSKRERTELKESRQQATATRDRAVDAGGGPVVGDRRRAGALLQRLAADRGGHAGALPQDLRPAAGARGPVHAGRAARPHQGAGQGVGGARTPDPRHRADHANRKRGRVTMQLVDRIRSAASWGASS